jgi:hypothetical protein
MCFECGRDSPSSYTEWHLKNTTTENIVFDVPIGDLHKLSTIPQGGQTLIDWGYANEDSVFRHFWNAGDSVVIELNGKVVRVWRESEKDNPGRQFFNGSYWIKSLGIREKSPSTIWTFELTPEDIAPQ